MKKLLLGLSFFALLLSCGESVDSSKEIEIEKDTFITFLDTDYETITFESEDGLLITANEFKIDDSSPIIVLCHQAQFNKFEYDGIAQRLNENGFNCIAIDQRSGGPIGSAQNETNLAAKEAEKPVGYLDARQDIKAAVNFAADSYDQKVILWGSSYSSTLVLWESLENENVKSVISFSPGDYFPEIGSLTDSISTFEKPFFITSGQWEIPDIDALLSKTTLKENQVQFKPLEQGHHGSRALWVNQEGGEEYWEAIISFLNTQK